MAKLIIFLIASFFLQAQVILGGTETNKSDTYQEKTLHDVVRKIKNNTDEFLNLLKQHRNSDDLVNTISGYVMHVEAIVQKLQKSEYKTLDLVIKELTTHLRKVLQLVQNRQTIIENDFTQTLIEITRIFEKLVKFTEMESNDVQQLLTEILVEYYFALNYTCYVLDT